MKPRRAPYRGALTAILLAMAGCFIALGIWQVERRAWKHALIAAVDARIHAPVQAPPAPDGWAAVSAQRDAYRHVRVTGRFLPVRDTFVRGVSDLGAGYWVVTPFDTGQFVVLINRGFVPQGKKASAAGGQSEIEGLLRITEPGGGFLRANDPKGDRWYSRDVAAIARARELGTVAPYFIDADARPDNIYPVGGMTVVTFSDNHLAYALTWFALAALSLAGLWLLKKGRAHSHADRL